MEIKKVKKNQLKKTRLWKHGFLMPPHSLSNFEVQNVIKASPDLMVFILEIVLKK